MKCGKLGGGWKWEIFSPYLSEETLKLIQAHVVMEDPDVEDLLYWEDDAKGKFTLKSAINIMRQETTEYQDHIWDLVWKAPVQQRIRAFMWLACHDRLMGNVNRFKRKLTDDTKCFICGESSESTLHILRDCPAARSIWRKVEGPSLDPTFFQEDLKNWILKNLENKEHETWPTFFAIIIWWLWRWRNMFVFGRGNEVPVDIGAFLKICFDEAWRSLHNNIQDIERRGTKEERFITWAPPLVGWYAMNTDGAARGSPGDAGGGVIIRNHCGTFISALTLNFGRCSAFRAEVLALLRGLELARNLQISHLQIQLDNLSCVQALNAGRSSCGGCSHLIRHCLSLIRKEDWVVKVIHVFREGNRAADWLANHGVDQSVAAAVLESAPLELHRIVIEDARGVTTPRLVPQ